MAKKEDEESKGTSLIKLLECMAKEDLDKLDEEIAAAERDLDTKKVMRKMIAVRLGIVVVNKPGTKKRTPAAAGSPAVTGSVKPPDPDTIVGKMLKYLAEEGPDTIQVICKELKMEYQSVYQAVNRCPAWFDKQTNGIHLTVAGHQAAKNLLDAEDKKTA